MNDLRSAALAARLLKTTEAADYLGLNPGTLANMRAAGAGPRYVRFGKRAIRYRIADCDAFTDAHVVEVGGQ